MATIYSNNETINIDPTDDLVLYKEEFINSRIEKFLYAICALDFDDLPTPLSRIEELYKCLATGLPAPTFVPQSRVEKYLMAILGSYDASALPVPQSRTEVLLNKILMGDTDLSDIEWLKSRYEFLLAYIAKGGKIDSGSGNDFEYLSYIFSSSTYSIYNTKELPVKSAILKGQTLVNMVPQDKQHIDGISNVNLTEGRLTWSTQSDWLKLYFVVNAKPNTKYIIKYHSINENVGIFCRPETTDPHSGWYENVTALNQIIYTYDVGTFVITLENAIASSDLWVQDFMIIEYQDGMENWDIPYFEGMGSVKMPVLTTNGKNLFDGKWAIGGIGNTNGLNSGGTSNIRTVNHISVKPNTTYVASSSQLQHANVVVWYAYDKNKKFISYSTVSSFFTTPSNCEFIRARTFDSDSTNISLDCVLQIEEGSVATEYEPYKSTTVTCNEEVELRGIGDVKDELDLLTGEFTRYIGEVVFDGSEDESYAVNNSSQTGLFTCFEIISMADKIQSVDETLTDDLLSDKVSSISHYNYLKDVEGFHNKTWTSTGASRLFLNLPNEKTNGTVEGLRVYLNSNPITLQYPLAEKVIKTVDISVVDQDGNNTKLSSFEDITHVTVTSEGILPDVELEVATKNEEVLNTMSLRMDDISTTQANLNETVNTQSENVDATMIATTEIYEGLL